MADAKPANDQHANPETLEPRSEHGNPRGVRLRGKIVSTEPTLATVRGTTAIERALAEDEDETARPNVGVEGATGASAASQHGNVRDVR